MNRVLEVGYALQLSGKEFIIKDIVGKGASSVTYLAEHGKTEHILKECNPLGIDMHRNEFGELVANTELDKRMFEECLERFKEGVKNQLALRLTKDLKNPTSNIQDIYYANGTAYIDMTYFGGKTYDKVDNESLYDLFRRMKALTQIVGHYHDMGYLHLDIKPQNIYTIPETPEMVMMFDFDSVTPTNNIDAIISSSYTDAWAAPEQKLQKYRNQICEATDFFAIGEIIFFKLFGKHSEDNDRYSFSQYKYSVENKLFKNINPVIFPMITELLHKTLSCSAKMRYQSADELINALEAIKEIAEQKVYIKTTLPSVSAKFIGRTEELKKIDAILKTKNVVFLTGFGGIGKTEIALKYAHDRLKEEYDTVSFLSFNKSIKETFCSDDLNIVGLNELKVESEDKLFETKLKVFKDLSSEKNLIILDNFDVKNDENLGRFCEELACKIIITTRNNGICEEYDEIIIEDMGVQKTSDLFRQYNQSDYPTEEINALNSIFKQINCHTMLVVLIAKHLKLSKQAPSYLKEKLQGKTGVTSINKTDMNQKKDKKIDSDTVVGHLLKLFNLSYFSDVQLEILRSLSSLGFVRINKDFFLDLLSMDCAQSKLNSLIEAGWINFDDTNNKVYLHQIILDLIYNEKNPSTENCPHITTGIIRLLQQEAPNYTSKKILYRLAEIFWERIQGNNILYANLIVVLHKTAYRTIDLCVAERIYATEKDTEKDLFEIYNLMMHKYYEPEGVDNIYAEIIDPIIQLVKKAHELCLKKIKTESEWAISSLINLSFSLDEMFNSITIELPEIECKKLLDCAASILYESKKYIENAVLHVDTKIKFLENIMEFFSGLDYTSLYRMENYMDSEFVIECQKLIDSFQDKEEGVIYINLNSYDSLAFKEHLNGHPIKALKLYKKALSEDDCLKSDIYSSMASVYFDMHLHRKWRKYLKLAFNQDTFEQKFSSYTCLHLIEAYIFSKKQKQAKKYCERLINHWKNSEETEKYFWLTIGYSKLFLITKNASEKISWQKYCFEVAKKIDAEKIDDDYLCDFWLIFLQHAIENKNISDFLRIFNMAEKADNKTSETIFRYICDCESSFIAAENKIQAILYLCSSCNAEDEKLALCQKAETLYKNNKLQNEYLYNCIIEQAASCYEYNEVYHYSDQCDYYLLTQKRCNDKSPAEYLEMWANAGSNYIWCYNGKFKDALRCYEKYFSYVVDSENSIDKKLISDVLLSAKQKMYCHYKLNDHSSMKSWAQECLKAISYVMYSETYEAILQEYTEANIEFACRMHDIDSQKEALILYFISVIIQTKKHGEQLFNLNGSIFDEFNFCFIEDLFCYSIQNTFSSQQIDDVASCCKYIKDLSKETDVSEKTSTYIENFFNQQVNNNLDFE